MKKILSLLLLSLISACATIGSLQPGKCQGIGNHQVGGTGRNGNMGEVVGLFIRPTTATADTYTVELASKKRMQTQITGQNWEPSIIAYIKAGLGI